jgi:hypothetical protein
MKVRIHFLWAVIIVLLCFPRVILGQSNINNVLYVGNGITAWGTGDIGSQINNAYAALPASGGTIVVIPQSTGACYSYTTPIVLTTLHKYVTLQGSSISNDSPPGSGSCLNYTPTNSTAAITLDYMNASGSQFPAGTGLRNFTLSNNGCITSSGCGSSATAIAIGNTHGGAYGATMENVSVFGFGTVFSVTNVATVGITWINPVFTANTLVFNLGNINGNHIVGGIINGNGKVLFQVANTTSELYDEGTTYFSNPGSPASFDYTSGGLTSSASFTNCHFESFQVGGTGANFFSGAVDLRLDSGIMEDDYSSGTGNWFINPSGYSLMIDGTKFLSRRPYTQIVLTTSGTRAHLRPINGSPAIIANWVGGSSTAYATVMPLTAYGGNSPAPWTIESSVTLASNLTVNGRLTKAAGSFRIDDPIDPANKYLEHSFVESPDMMNVYNGIVILNSNGEADVNLPAYFEALNKDFRYQLTPIGGYAPLYVAREVAQNSFRIAGGKPGLRVSWQVTGIRQDAYANAHRIPVEEEKPPSERGHYLIPESNPRPK